MIGVRLLLDLLVLGIVVAVVRWVVVPAGLRVLGRTVSARRGGQPTP